MNPDFLVAPHIPPMPEKAAEDVAVRVIYYAGRFLTHRISRGTFKLQLDSERASVVVQDTVFRVLDEVEAQAGAPIAELSGDVRHTFTRRLDKELHEIVMRDAPPVEEIEAMLEDLRKTPWYTRPAAA